MPTSIIWLIWERSLFNFFARNVNEPSFFAALRRLMRLISVMSMSVTLSCLIVLINAQNDKVIDKRFIKLIKYANASQRLHENNHARTA